MGEPLPHSSTILTGANAEADLLLTTGSLVKIRPNSKLVLSAFWQKDFRASAKKVTDLKEETSPSRVAFKLETGDLVVDVKKLNRESSFVVESELGVAGVRGTQFGLTADADSTELAVLEGIVGFMDANLKAKSVETAQKVAGSQDGTGELNTLPESEKAELAKAVADSQESASGYDLTRLSNTVDGYALKPNYIVKSALNMELIWCPPGSFIMGAGSGDDEPAHPVILTKGFYLGKYEVTQKEYQKVMGNNPSAFKGEKLPVEMVSWNDAVEFCQALSKMERVPRGYEFVLPTEAQWEYACRAGTTTSYSWGNEITPQWANYIDNGLRKTAEVGSYPPNSWGFYDIHGNVWEWCQDWFGPLLNNSATDPIGAGSGSDRIQRGGSWNPPGTYLQSAFRNKYPPSGRGSHMGLRVSLQKK